MAAAGEGVEVLQPLWAHLGELPGIPGQTALPADVQQPQGEVPVPVLSQGDGVHVRVVPQALVDPRGDLQGRELFRLGVQQGGQGFRQLLQHLLLDLIQQVVNVLVVGVKGAPVHPGFPAQLGDRNALDGFLLQQHGKGLADAGGGQLGPGV